MKLAARALRNRPVRMIPPCGALILLHSSSQREPAATTRTTRSYQRTRAFYRSVGFLPARELPDLWPGNKALLLAMPLDGPPV
jgi:hypothetical protein